MTLCRVLEARLTLNEKFALYRAARGTKHVCPACEARFYDLKRSPIVCPACSSLFVPPPPLRAKPLGGTRNRWRDLTPAPKYVAPEIVSEEASDPEASEVDTVRDDLAPAGPDDVPEEIQEEGDMSGLLDVNKNRDE